MTQTKPLISILICNYNYDAYLEECLKSATEQDYENLEIVILDDGSNDNSVKNTKGFIENNSGKKIRLEAKKKNEGICFTRNRAINSASGEYFIFLDSDDTLPPDYVTKLYEIAISNKADVVYGDVRRFGEETSASNYPQFDQSKLLLDNIINISSLVRKAAVGNHRFDTELNRKSHEDYDFWLGLSLMGLKFVKANGVYLNYRIQNMSRNLNTQSYASRSIEFIEVWLYMMEKYSKVFDIPDDIYELQMKYQVERIGTELTSLNDVVQNDLNPEIERRAMHIQHQGEIIADKSAHIESLEASINSIRGSKDYRIGNLIMRNLRRFKKLISK